MARSRSRRVGQLKPVRRNQIYAGPHSWAVSEWSERVPSVYPYTTQKAKYLTRVSRDELILAGALTRIGRDLVILGEPYDKWLRSKRNDVVNYEAPGLADSPPKKAKTKAVKPKAADAPAPAPAPKAEGAAS